MAVIAAHILPCGEGLGAAFDFEGLIHLDLAQRGAAIVCPVAIRASCGATALRSVLVTRNPGIASGVHAVRTTGDGIGHRDVTGRALIDGPCMTLNIVAQHIVVNVGSRVFGMRCTVTGFTLQPAVAAAKTVQIETGRRGIGIGCKALIGPDIGHTCCIDAAKFALTVMVTGLASRLIEPTGAGNAAYGQHAAMAALAIHRRLTAGIERVAHWPAQALRHRSGMAQVAGRAVAAAVEGELGERVLDAGMQAVQGLRERGNTGDAGTGQRI